MKRWLRRAWRGARSLNETAGRELAGSERSAAHRAEHRDAGDRARDCGDWTCAAHCYRLHLRTQPDDAAIWVQLGHALKESGDLDAADAAYGAAQALTPADGDVLLSRGHVAKLRGDLIEAAGYYHLSYAADRNQAAAAELLAPEMARYLASFGLQGPGAVGAVQSGEAGVIFGWVVDPAARDAPAIEILHQGRVVAVGTVGEPPPPPLEAAPLGARGFRIDVSEAVDLWREPLIAVRLKSTSQPLPGSPLRLALSDEARRWLGRHDHLTPHEVAAIRADRDRRTEGRLLSLVMPVGEISAGRLTKALESVRDQWCSRWELICVVQASADPITAEILSSLGALDERVRVISEAEVGDRARAANLGISAAAGDHVAILDAEGILEPEAVFRLLDAVRTTGAELIYGDEIVVGAGIDAIERFVARPAFSRDFYLSLPYFGPLICVKRDTALAAGGMDEAMSGAIETDLVLRVIERAGAVAHIPAMLSRRRRTAARARGEPADAPRIEVVQRHLDRIGAGARAETAPGSDACVVRYPDDHGRTLIIIPTRDRADLLGACLDSIAATTSRDEVDVVVIDHESTEPQMRALLDRWTDRTAVMPYAGPFNFSRMNNAAARAYGGEHRYLLFMNNDVEAIEPGWLETMRSLAARAEVGVVGATLLYDDRRVQHAGVVVGMHGAADHVHRLVPLSEHGRRSLGYDGSLVSTRDYSAVTAACMMVRAETFLGVGGFDEDFMVGFNDTDLCLRIGALGYSILNSSSAVLFHHESATRRRTDQVDHPEDAARFVRRWARAIADGDPFYSPLLSLQTEYRPGDIGISDAPVRVRRVRPRLRPLAEGLPPPVLPPVLVDGVVSGSEPSA